MTGKPLFLIPGSLLVILLAGCSPKLTEKAPSRGTVDYADQLRPGKPPGAARLTEKEGIQPAGGGPEHADPRQVGINPDTLGKIDAIAEEAIREGATPGAVVMVLKDGKIVFDQAYGHHTYDGEVPTRSSDIFDVASLTKIFATTLAAMRLVDQGKLDLDATVGTYLEELNGSHPDKAAIRVRDLLTHQAGLVPYLPFYSHIQDGDCSTERSPRYPVQVAAHLYLARDYYREVMWRQMLDSPLRTPGKYVYSDIGMYMMKEVLERITQQPLDLYVDEQFYQPMGLRSIGFRPLERFAADRIVPTEEDTYFRKQLLHGYVQDPGAAMAGGVAGHAGLFASAGDLAVLSQMLLNGGSYDGRQYVRAETVKHFTSRQSDASRRGLGFDCCDPESKEGYPCRLAPSATFGHTGYTGTCVWIDPENRLVYIFLSNRLYPSPDTSQLMKLNIRPRIQDVIYEAIQGVPGRTAGSLP